MAPIQIRGLDHLVLRVADEAQTRRFYCDVLGCQVERRNDEYGLVQLRAGTALIDVVPLAGKIGSAGGAAPGAEGRNVEHFCLNVEPFDEAAIRAHLAANGFTAQQTKRRYGADGYGYSIYVEDPDGNTVELKGPPDEDQSPNPA